MQRGSIILDPEEWPRGIVIVLVTSASGDVCQSDGFEEDLSVKRSSPLGLSIAVGSNGTDFQTFKATIIVTACYLIIGLFSICISVIVFKFKLDLDDPESLETKSKVPGVVNPTFHEDEPVITALVHIGSTLNMPVNPTEIGENKTKKVPTTVSSISTKLSDKTQAMSMYRKSRLYLGILWLMSIFYSLPVIQMVFRFSHQQKISGNQDICYYNDRCKKPFKKVADFNHIFSNLGYCVFGLLFMFIVRLRKHKNENFKKRMEERETL